MKEFNNLSPQEQDEIRLKYKITCPKEYYYSIKLFILNVILGIISLIGLVLTFKDLILGLIVFTVSFIINGIVVYFLNLSNQNFFRFLKKKYIKYKQ